MEEKLKKEIIEYIKKNDSRKEIILNIAPNKDFSGGKIKYNKENIILHRNISELTDEEYIRAFLVVKLIKELKYPSKFIELEKEYKAGRPKRIKPRIDIIVKDKDEEKTFLFIEVKSPDKFESDRKFIEDQLFELAKLEGGPEKVRYLVYYTADISQGVIEDLCLVIDYKLFSDYNKWLEEGGISVDKIPREWGIARKSIYVNKDERDLLAGEKLLDKSVTREKFNQLRRDLHDVLWGGGGMFYNEIFSNLVKLFLAKYTMKKQLPMENHIDFKFNLKMVLRKLRKNYIKELITYSKKPKLYI